MSQNSIKLREHARILCKYHPENVFGGWICIFGDQIAFSLNMLARHYTHAAVRRKSGDLSKQKNSEQLRSSMLKGIPGQMSPMPISWSCRHSTKKDTTNYVALYSTSTAFFLPDFPEFQLFRSLKLLPQFQRFQTCSNQTILAPGSRAAPSSRTRWYSGSMRFLRAALVSIALLPIADGKR